MVIKVRLPFLPAEGEPKTTGFIVGFSQWGADLLPGQSASVKTATACTHMHSTPQKKKKEKKKKTNQRRDRRGDNVMTKCVQFVTKKKLINQYLGTRKLC